MATEKSVEGKKQAEKPKKSAAKKEKEAPTRWGTKDVAKQLNVDPKFFRSVLRAAGKGADGQRYDWPIGDPLKAERKLIADYQKRQEERKENATAKASEEKEAKKKSADDGKKTDKKASKSVPAKKSKKAPESEEEEADESEEVFEE